MINILLPTDFSENANSAADFIFDLFDPKKVKLTVVHAVTPPRSTPGMMIDLGELMIKDADKDLAEEKKRIALKFLDIASIETKSKLGYLKDVLPSLCSAYRTDIMVMGTKGENSLSSKILGSNTENIIREGTVPILAVPLTYTINDTPRICIASSKDEVPNAEALKHISDNLKNMGKAQMSVLNVLTSTDEKSLKSIPFNGLQVAVEVEIASDPEKGIIQHLEKHETDLLVVTHRHNSRIDYLFQRSTTKKLAGKMDVPLLIFLS